jgi:hypothetical protein
MLCISWGSTMSRACTATSKFLYTVIPDELISKGVTEEELYAILVWSFHCMANGTWPSCDHTGKPWAPSSFRAMMAGRRLAGPYVCLFSEYRGDWEWVVNTFHWRSICFSDRHRGFSVLRRFAILKGARLKFASLRFRRDRCCINQVLDRDNFRT